jgi:ABC-type polysaccharide/polyol phosphate transport system ATPase subunit
MAIITVENISKVYPDRPGAKALLGRGGIASWFRKAPKPHAALEDISLAVNPGESLGIIGGNGSGKSTLLKILAGVTLPTTGTVRVEGRVASLLELGAGFHPMLTGRENVYLNAAILGLQRHEVDAVFDDIVAFSGIGEFIDQPVDTYSSGMYVRIAFSVAVHANPDIFLVDEVLAVGDEAFQRKCRQKIGELKEAGKTIVFVSHDLGIVNALCDRVVLLSQGHMIERDNPQEAIEYYLRQIGHAGGIHRMRGHKAEAIFSHGHFSLYHDGHEVTAPHGINLILRAFEQLHPTTEADWEVTSDEPDHFIAVGTLSRMPLRAVWKGRLTNDVLTISVALDVTQECTLDAATIEMQLPTAITRFHLGTGAIDAPPIPSTALEAIGLTQPDAGCRKALALDPEKKAPPFSVAYEPHDPHFTVQLLNTDYMMGARNLAFTAQRPKHDNRLTIGRHDLAAFTIDLSLSPTEAREKLDTLDADRTIQSGPLAVKAGRGHLACYDNNTCLTHAVHAQTMFSIGNLWVLSSALAWTAPVRDGDQLELSARSLRFPLQLRWRLRPDDPGVYWEATLIADAPLTLNGYNTTLALDPAFAHWDLGDESGDWPDFHPEQAWRGVNTRYTPTHTVTATRPDGARIGLRLHPDESPRNPSALNTGGAQGARVLQLIQNPDQADSLHFEPGEHTLFRGWITLDRPHA